MIPIKNPLSGKKEASMASQLPDYFKTGLKFVQDFVIPAAIIGLQFTPAGPAVAGATIAVKVIGAAPDIMAMVQRTMDTQDGATKKLFAMATAKALADTIGGVSGGGQKETWDKISGVLGQLIDHSIAAINQGKPEEKAGG
jgi:hypothetical protein